MRLYIIKLALLSTSILMFTAARGVATEGRKVPSAKAKATPVEQEKKSVAQPDLIKPELPPTQSSSTGLTDGEEVNWLVLSKGGTQGTSTNYWLGVTIGQNIIGTGSSTNYDLNLGFWQNFGGCCQNRGNVDGLISHIGPIDVADLTYLVGFLFRGGTPPPCEEEGNTDGIISHIGLIDIADLTYLVEYLFRGGPNPPPCP